MAKLEVGEQAPKFSVDTLSGRISLDELLESAQAGVIVYFYPKASTPGCTKEACDFRDSLESLQSSGYQVIGISPDQLPALEKFVDEQSLNFLLGADPDHQIMEAYGVWGEKNNYGKTVVGVIRSTVVISKDGVVQLAQYNVKATGHVARLRTQLGID